MASSVIDYMYMYDTQYEHAFDIIETSTSNIIRA